MASINFALPANIASFLTANVPGFAAASGGDGTVTLQVPGSAVPTQVVQGLADAGFPVTVGASPSDLNVAVPPAASAPATAVAMAGVAQFAPAGLVPQGAALADPSLAGANLFAQSMSEWGAAATAFFEQAAANPPPADFSGFASWATAQQQAVLDYFGGM